jgi:hypothetical protein
MATIDFPNSPAVDDIFTAGNSSYKWTGAAWVSNNLGQVEWDDITGKPTTFPSDPAAISTKTGAYTLVAGDTNDLIQADGTFTITVPASTIPAGTRVDIVNTGTGVITIAGSGLTLQSKDSAVTIASQYAGATLFFTSTTTALLIGDLT